MQLLQSGVFGYKDLIPGLSEDSNPGLKLVNAFSVNPRLTCGA